MERNGFAVESQSRIYIKWRVPIFLVANSSPHLETLTLLSEHYIVDPYFFAMMVTLQYDGGRRAHPPSTGSSVFFFLLLE